MTLTRLICSSEGYKPPEQMYKRIHDEPANVFITAGAEQFPSAV